MECARRLQEGSQWGEAGKGKRRAELDMDSRALVSHIVPDTNTSQQLQVTVEPHPAHFINVYPKISLVLRTNIQFNIWELQEAP